MPTWTLPEEIPVTDPTLSAADRLRGRDIRYTRGDLVETPAGDWATVEGTAAIRQSVLHEAQTAPGELVYRPEYGMGLAQLVKGPLSKANLDAARNRVRERLEANQRIARVREATLERVELGTRAGARIVIRADGLDGNDLGMQPIVVGEG